MTIAVDVSRANQPQRTGPASYAWNVVRELVHRIQNIEHRTKNIEHQVKLLAAEEPVAEWGVMPAGISWKRLQWIGRGWTSVRLPWHLARMKYDIFWQPTSSLIYLPKKTRGVVTVHDLAFLEVPQVYSADNLRRQHRLLHSGLRYLTHCIAVSEYTKQQIIELAGWPAERISVIPLATDEGMVSVGIDRYQSTEKRYNLQHPYLITVSRIEKKKGITEIVEALSQLPDGIDLVLVGQDGYGAGEVRQRVVELHLEGRVHFLGWVESNDLPALISGALAYVSACRYEGFGIAVLNALACGCPVVAYRAGAVPETVGEAAVLVDPIGSESLVAGIRTLLESQPERERLSKLGLTRVAEFSWKKTAEQTWSCLTNI